MCVLVTQSCPTLCNSMDCSLPGSSSTEVSKQEWWGGLPQLSPGDLPDLGLNLGLLYCRQFLYHLSYLGSPWAYIWTSIILEYIPSIQTLWRRKWQPTPVFLTRESHGQRSLVGNSPWGRKESDSTERLTHTHTRWGEESFYHKWMCSFVKCFFCIWLYGLLRWSYDFYASFVNVCITLIDFQILNHPCTPG